MTRVSFFSSPIGLGHATRDDAVAQLLDHTQIQFVTGAGAALYFKKLGYDVKDEYKPPSFEVKNGRLEKSFSWLWRYYKYYKECKKISSQIIDSDTNLIVSDEDFASLVIAQKRKIPNVLITDILETKFTKGVVTIIEKKMNKSMNQIIKNSNAVIVPEFGDSEGNLHRVGPIVRKTNQTREDLRKKFGFTKKTITISIGGTNTGRFLIEKTIPSVKKLSEDVDVVLVSGPSLHTNYENVRNLGFVENLHEIIFASDLLISLAGKSTIDEAKAYGTPGIFIPIKDHFEQEDNAKAEGYSFDDIHRLDKLIEEKLEQKRGSVNCNGAQKASEIIKSFL